MAGIRLTPEESVLVVVDIQPAFMKGVFEAERVVDRSVFLVRIARLLGIPTFGTVQNPDRMGGLDERILAHLDPAEVLGKMSFSCFGGPGFVEALQGRRKVVLVGVETHICVSQTACDLLHSGREVAVCPDAVSARTLDRHKLGMERIRDAGAVPAHTEAVAYEWMKSAEHPRFKEALQIVKETPL